jgi:hypothetical protein
LQHTSECRLQQQQQFAKQGQAAAAGGSTHLSLQLCGALLQGLPLLG